MASVLPVTSLGSSKAHNITRKPGEYEGQIQPSNVNEGSPGNDMGDQYNREETGS